MALVAAAGAGAQEGSRVTDVPRAPQQQGEPKENRLAKETSPYLRQHRTNPVDWYPWGEEAFARAREEDKPIFLSIGYSACHWCHVMAKESFADPAIAALLNAGFVCIKVDREERPDVDEIYLAAVQAMGQQGGWPLSMWLLPDGAPFYGGTYFPPADAHGLPSFRRVVEGLATAWRDRRDEIRAGAADLRAHLQQALAPASPPGEPQPALVDGFVADARRRFDAEHGGFAPGPSLAPKFPAARELQVLLRTGDAGARAMVDTTLRAMRRGGIHDQLGGGFHRYATDRAWVVPHFEKMLYDNALLASCYLDAFDRSGDPLHAAVARSTLEWMLREMRHPGGAFFASQDAQSEGVEGRFFVWKEAEFDALLGDDAEFAKRCFGVTAAGNHEGANVLIAAHADALSDADRARLERVRGILFAARAQRVRPATDDKILCAWNGLALGALAAGFRSLGDERYRDAARAAADFLLRELVVDGRCFRHWHAGRARQPGFLEDHALLAEGLLALFEIDSDPRWLVAIRGLLGTIRQHFAAPDGRIFATADDHEQLIARTASPFESSIPSGTAAAVHALLRGGLLLGDLAAYDAGVAALRAHHAAMTQAPAAVASLLLAVQFHLGDPREIVIAGEPQDPRTTALLRAAWRAESGPHVVALVAESTRRALETLSPVFGGKQPVDGAPAAYVCRRGTCEAPTTDPEVLRRPR